MYQEKLILATVILLATVCISDCARILVFQTNPSKSHNIVMEPLFVELASRGHNLTVYSCFPHETPVPNLQDINICSSIPSIVSNLSHAAIKEGMSDPFSTTILMSTWEHSYCDFMFKEEPIQNLLKSKESVDLVIAETFANDCFAPFAQKFKAPLVSFVTSISVPWASDRVGLPDNPSYIPNYFVPFSAPMTFTERFYNSVVLAFAKLYHRFYTIPNTQELVNKYFGDSIPKFQQVLKNTSLLLVNGHFSISMSRPFTPNVVEIGGIHIKESKRIPKDLQMILDQSSAGVVLVSFGSVLRTASISPDIINVFMKVFASMPQTFIFKYEADLRAPPPNVLVRKWLPQKEILEHKNVKAYFGHGGLASTIEAVHFGKPMVGIPFFADQNVNLKALEDQGAGITLNLKSLTEEQLATALKVVLVNPRYTKNMQRLSAQFRDRPLSALESAVFWTEYVIRYQGAPHLQPASVHQPLYQYLLLDVLTVLLAAASAVFIFIYFLVRLICLFIYGENNKKLLSTQLTRKDISP